MIECSASALLSLIRITLSHYPGNRDCNGLQSLRADRDGRCKRPIVQGTGDRLRLAKRLLLLFPALIQQRQFSL